MDLRLFVLLSICVTSFGHYYQCNHRSAVMLLKRTSNDFSVSLLQRVSEDIGTHFVFSPLATWLQLATLGEGAKGQTAREIRTITRYPQNVCFKRKLREIIIDMSRSLGSSYSQKNFVIIDKLLAVKPKFIKKAHIFYGVRVMPLNFNDPVKSAERLNRIISVGTNNIISDPIYKEDFDNTFMFVTDNTYFRSTWKMPFSKEFTKIENFHSELGPEIGEVNMMSQIGYFSVTKFPKINATVLEMPCTNERFSMLLFLPNKGTKILDFFYLLEKIRLTSIFNMFKAQKPKLVNLKMPRFGMTSEIDNIPALLHDMGVESLFDSNRAELSGVSNFTVFPSLMFQTTDIEVIEEGVTASSVSGNFVVKNVELDFYLNRPFSYTIVDKKTEFILFGGSYSVPEVYDA